MRCADDGSATVPRPDAKGHARTDRAPMRFCFEPASRTRQWPNFSHRTERCAVVGQRQQRYVAAQGRFGQSYARCSPCLVDRPWRSGANPATRRRPRPLAATPRSAGLSATGSSQADPQLGTHMVCASGKFDAHRYHHRLRAHCPTPIVAQAYRGPAQPPPRPRAICI